MAREGSRPAFSLSTLKSKEWKLLNHSCIQTLFYQTQFLLEEVKKVLKKVSHRQVLEVAKRQI